MGSAGEARPVNTDVTLLLPSGEVLRETLRDGEALLIGRAPDPAELDPAALDGASVTLRAVTVPDRTVSSLHALVLRAGGRVVVRDLGSRNGTRCVLSESPASFGDLSELTLQVATARAPVSAAARPDDAVWREPAGFPAAVVDAVNRWLVAGRYPVRAALSRRGEARGWFAPIAITGEHCLSLQTDQPEGTVDPLWSGYVQTVVEYVHEQRGRFELERADVHPEGFVLAAPAFADAHRTVADASMREMQLILLGETGVGKGTLARCYHLHGPRRDGPFEAVNCAEIDKQFSRTRLFGAKKGAYTGCTSDQAGAVECAHKGTLFLDELVELPSDVQGELLAFLDDHRYKRLGDDQWRVADVQVVAGTNSDLREAVRAGKFRADLWYRLAGRIVEVPPLRERPEDVRAYLSQRPVCERADAPTSWGALSPEAQRLVLREHPWRGNFRELAAFARRISVQAAAGGVSLDEARALLAEGALDARPLTRVDEQGWASLLSTTADAWRRRAMGADPARLPDVKDYVEEVLKPLFVARSLGLEGLTALPDRPSPSFEEMGRRIGCDGATVRNQLQRYLTIKPLLGG